jgi:hypothetical protein
MSRKDRRGASKRSYKVPIAVTLVVITGVVGYYIFSSSGITQGSPLIGQSVSSTVLNDLNDVSITTLNTVGSGPSSIVSPKSTESTTTGVLPPVLSSGTKPEVLYMGAEYCPYCAAERWAMIVALDKFGSFSGIEYMQSSASDIYPNTPTFTFLHASYTSSYITFVSVEQEDRSELPLQTPLANQTALMTTYDSGASIPFIDIANQYVQVGSQYTPPTLAGADGNWTLIASQVNTPSSTYATYIDGAANRLISAICKVDGSQPTGVCGQTLADTLSYTTTHSGTSQLAVSDAVLTNRSSPAAAPRAAPNRITYWV